jgi:hypothetical protein
MATCALQLRRSRGRQRDDSASILREFAGRWPIGRDDRAKLSQFIALHTVRTPAWRSAYEAVSIEAICDTLGRERHDPDTEGAAIRAFLSDQLQVDALLKQVPRLASLLMSMQWTLLEFDEPLILRTGAAHTGSAGSMQDSTPRSSAPSPYRRNAARRVRSVTIQAERRRPEGLDNCSS